MICPHCQKERSDVIFKTVCEHCKIPYDTSRISKKYLIKLKEKAGIVERKSGFSVVLGWVGGLINMLGYALPKLGKIVGVIVVIVVLLKACTAIVDSGKSADEIKHGIFMLIIFLGVVASAMRQDESDRLHKKFKSLGVLAGRAESEIIAAVGLPVSRSTMPDGSVLLQWQATGFHIALIFDINHICKGITHEFVHPG